MPCDVASPALPLAGLALVLGGTAFVCFRARYGIALAAVPAGAALVVTALLLSLQPATSCPRPLTLDRAVQLYPGLPITLREGRIRVTLVTRADGTRLVRLRARHWPADADLTVEACPSDVARPGRWSHEAIAAVFGARCQTPTGPPSRASAAGVVDVTFPFPVALPGTDCGVAGACRIVVFDPSGAWLATVV